jgi:hypothetical protein
MTNCPTPRSMSLVVVVVSRRFVENFVKQKDEERQHDHRNPNPDHAPAPERHGVGGSVVIHSGCGIYVVEVETLNVKG